MTVEDIPNPHPTKLLDDYLTAYSRRDPSSLGNTIIRHRSLEERHLVARFILRDKGHLKSLIQLARSGSFSGAGITKDEVDPGRLASLARVLALQDVLPSDLQDALKLYDLVLNVYGPDNVAVEHQNLHAQLAYALGQLGKTRYLLETYRRMFSSVRKVLELNLANPVHDSSSNWDAWSKVLQELMPVARYEFSDDTPLPPFDRLSARPLNYYQDGTKVSVAITCFKPGPQLIAALKSIISQSWRNLEILLVDDGSPGDYTSILRKCEGLDDRVRLIQLPENAGTYVARNVAIDMAQGELLTFQDSDDWCHPNRIEHQLSLMLANPALVVTTTNGLKVNDDLTINRVGRPLVDISMPTMMLRIQDVKARVGYFHSIRKSADGEYLRRLQAAFGENSWLHEKAPAYKLLRQTTGSLSRSDFGTGGWMHPAREAYMSAYVHWHSQIREGKADPYLPREGNQNKIPAAPHLLTNGQAHPKRKRYDYIFATDWRPYGAPAKAIIEEIKAVKSVGRSVGILQLETFRYMSTAVRPLCGPVQELINNGTVDRVIPMDPIEASLLIIRYPSVLQFVADTPMNVVPDSVIILANQAPMERDGSDWRYVSTICSANAERLFKVKPLWVPEGPATREALEREGVLAPDDIADFNMPCILNVDEWYLPRNRFRSDIPVVGRHSRDHYTKWPETESAMLEVYPDDPNIDFRFMGGSATALEVLGTRRLPKNWISFDYDELPVKTFLRQLDFWVYFHHSVLVESFGRAILEAMAAGCVVILPESFRSTFGSGTVYCEIQEVRDVIDYYYADLERYREQSERSVRYVREHFSYDRYLELLQRIEHVGAPANGEVVSHMLV